MMFDPEHKTYYYLTEDDSMRAGDLVIVLSVGKDHHQTLCKL